MGNLGTINTCSGTFYDSGGPIGDFGVNDNYVATFCSSSGLPIWLQFSQLDLGFNFFTVFNIYNGNSTSAPLIAQLGNSTILDTFISNNSSNCLTVEFEGGGFFSTPAAGWEATIICADPPTPTPCIEAQPFCSGTSYNFPAATNTNAHLGPHYGCLATRPNPVWYYMQIDNPGNLDLTFTNSNSVDVDFICWGPFSSLNGICSQLTADNEVDCSYSTSAIENINISNAQAGEYYMLCITNYSNSPTNFILTTDATSTASTNCKILCNITDMTASPGSCNPADNLHSVSGTLTVTFPPANGTLTISTNTGQSITLNPPFSGSINYTISGISSTGTNIDVTAQFSDDTSCHFTTTYLSPAPCTCTAMASNNSPLCIGSTVNLTGNTIAGATFQWSGPNGFSSNQQNPVINNVSATEAGIYTLTVTLGACTATDTTLVEVVSSPTIAFVTQPVSCNGGSDGQITANAIPSGVTYNWSTGSSNQTITGLTAGTYSVVVSLGTCSASASASVTEPSAITSGGTIITDATCAQGGSISTTISGGTSPYTYLWSNGQSTSFVNNLAAGPYDLTVTDQNACSITATYTVGAALNAITFGTPVIDDPNCNGGGDGSITANASGGTGTISFVWNNTQTGAVATNLSAGSYTLTATDANNCSATVTYVVSEPAPVVFGTPTITDASCSLGGSVTVSASGGTGTISFVWDNAQTGPSVTNISAGSYSVTATDQNLCTASASYTVGSAPGVVVISNPVIANVSCTGGSDGSITVTVSGGTGTLMLVWSNSQTGTSITGLTAGNYSVTATDQAGCSASAAYVITESSTLTVSATSANATCNGAANGMAEITISGGTTPYSFLWSDGQTTQIAANLRAGNYTCTVTDANSCSISASATVAEPADMILQAQGNQVKCIGDRNGTISVNANGGTQPYNFSATQDFANFVFATDDTIRDLAVGTYSVIVADSNGCTKTVSAAVPDATPDAFDTRTDSTTCAGADVADGGAHIIATTFNDPYQYAMDGGSLQNSGDFLGLSAGLHTITAVNGNGCVSSVQVLVPEPLPIVVDIIPDSLVLPLGGTANVQVVYLNASNVTYSWTPFTGLSCADCANPTVSVFERGDYEVTVRPQSGSDVCFGAATLHVEVEEHQPVFVPNSFSPNGDGNNDQFLIFGAGIKAVDLKIFNRWGEIVYATNNVLAGWDGTYKGKLQLPQVFTYTARVTFLDDVKEEVSGSLMLLR